MKTIKKPVPFQWIKEDLLPLRESYDNVDRILTSDIWKCPCCGKAECWESVMLPNEMEKDQEVDACPAGTFIAGLGKIWEVEPWNAVRILTSLIPIEQLGVAVEPRLNLAERLTDSVLRASRDIELYEGGFELGTTASELLTEILSENDQQGAC